MRKGVWGKLCYSWLGAKDSISIEPKVFYNTSVAQIKAIARNSPYKQARFVIDKENKLHGVDANSKIIHRLLVPKEQQHIQGNLMYIKPRDEYVTDYTYSGEEPKEKHPILKRLEQG